jgi:hypothetical protein
MNARWTGWIAALALVAVAVPAGAFSRTGGVWRTLPVQWYWNPSSVPASLGGPENGRMAMEAGFATWSSAPCTMFTSTNAGTTMLARGSARDRINTFSWVSGSWPAELGAVNTVIGVTLPVSSGGSNIDADIVYNNVGFTWSLDGRPPAGGSGGRSVVDTESIAVHEQGHFLGLGHTLSPRESIMYPSYPGRPNRVMSSDDQLGVCTLYPRTGGPLPDAGVGPDVPAPGDPCNAITSCGECTPQATCGWCASTRRCMTGVVAGPTVGSCPSGWSPFPMNCTTAAPDASTTPDVVVSTPDVLSVDPCAGYGACGTCAAALNCGWCGAANRCMYATMASGPARETCTGGWAIEPSVCPGGGSGTTMFGGSCRTGTDCSTGGPCVNVSGGTPFCSQRCTDDCTCPRGYRCVDTSAGFSVCIPGTNTCGGGPDASVAPPDVITIPADAPSPRMDVAATSDVTQPLDVSQPDVSKTDAAESDVSDPRDSPEIQGGCGCTTHGTTRPSFVFVFGLFVLIARRRRTH